MSQYGVLSLDGGGIRGVVTARLLEHIEQAHPGFVASTDLVAGTSTGGIIALAVKAGVPLKQITELYVKQGKTIFRDTLLDDMKDLGRLLGAEYSNKGLQMICRDVLGDRTMRDLAPSVLVTTFELAPPAPAHPNDAHTYRPWIIHNVAGTDEDGDTPAWKAAMYTSAAPTYFPSFEGKIDGGVYANNPSMIALAQTQDPRNSHRPELGAVRLLSLGTGTQSTVIKGDRHDWGIKQWARPLIDLMIDGVSGISDFQCRQWLGDRYARFNPVLPPGLRVGLDAADRADELAGWADLVAKSPEFRTHLDWLSKHWGAPISSQAPLADAGQRIRGMLGRGASPHVAEQATPIPAGSTPTIAGSRGPRLRRP